MMGRKKQPVLLHRQSGARSQSYSAGRAKRKSDGGRGGTQMEDAAVADRQGTQFTAPVGRD